jgi:hypothetical protein
VRDAFRLLAFHAVVDHEPVGGVGLQLAAEAQLDALRDGLGLARELHHANRLSALNVTDPRARGDEVGENDDPQNAHCRCRHSPTPRLPDPAGPVL